MPFKNGYSPPSVWYNAVQHRYTGVVGYDPVDHAKGNGPLGVSVGSSGTSIVVDVNTGNAQIRREEFAASGGPQTLASNATNSDPRRDVIYVAEGGSIGVAQGENADDAIYPYDGSSHQTDRPQGPSSPLPEGPHMAGLARCPLATVKVPAGASDSNDITNGAIHDIRRPAIKPRREPWQQPQSLSGGAMEPGDRRRWGAIVPPGHTVSVWSLGQDVYALDFDDYDLSIRFKRVYLTADGHETDVLYNTTGQYAQGDPLASDSVPADASEPYRYVIEQYYDHGESDALPGNNPAIASASWTVDPTDETF